jgi:hypothetical protein
VTPKLPGRLGVTAGLALTLGLPWEIIFRGGASGELQGMPTIKGRWEMKSAPNIALNTLRGVPEPRGHLPQLTYPVILFFRESLQRGYRACPL